MEYMFLVNTYPSCIVFYSSAIHSFISIDYMCSSDLRSNWLDKPLKVASPLGRTVVLD